MGEQCALNLNGVQRVSVDLPELLMDKIIHVLSGLRYDSSGNLESGQSLN